jgi:hypothetical protein
MTYCNRHARVGRKNMIAVDGVGRTKPIQPRERARWTLGPLTDELVRHS